MMLQPNPAVYARLLGLMPLDREHPLLPGTRGD
jgi:hypothetical protein